jgi:general secretion pathway protein A
MYCSFFGFAEQPFNVTPDPRFLFLTDSHREALASMIYGICERKGFISITGEVGTGKTTLIRHLLDILHGKRVHTVFLYQTVLTFDQLLKETLLELDMPPGDERKTSMIRQLDEYLIQRLARNENVALIIDEAQNLDRQVLEELRLLSNLETNSCKLIQILLVGQPELEAKLSSPELRQLKQRISIGRKIRPLNGEESRQYTEHRLGLVGSSISEVFKPEALSLICDYARGVPRNINMLCDNAFLIGYGLAQKKIDANIVREAAKDMGLSAPENPVAQKEILQRPQMVPRKYHRPWGTYSRAALLVFLILILSLAFFLGKEFIKGTPNKLEASHSLTVYPRPPHPSRTETRVKKIVTVESGDTIISLSQKYYQRANTTLLDKILEINPGITNRHLILAEQKLEIPEITEASLVIPSPDGTCKVHLGTFSRPGYADSYKNEPILKGKSIEVIPRKVSPGETWYRVFASKFANRDEALSALRALKEKRILPIP